MTSATLDIGQSLNFEDDGPTITADGVAPELTVDETDPDDRRQRRFAAASARPSVPTATA